MLLVNSLAFAFKFIITGFFATITTKMRIP
jgi:hypothetical protein